MHHWDLVALRIFGGHRAGVRHARLLFDRQRIHVCAEQDRRPIAIAQYPRYAVLANPGRHLATRLAQFLGHARCALRFLEGQFRMGMQMLVEFEEAGVFLHHT
jgi:hypothetical protein